MVIYLEMQLLKFKTSETFQIRYFYFLTLTDTANVAFSK